MTVALDAVDDAVVYVSLGARVSTVAEHAARHDARIEVERRRHTKPRTELLEYLSGARQDFSVAVRPLGTTFQRRAWDALCRIPFGQTRNYAAQAKSIGQTKAVRAVGRANGANPISIIVPCHRVVGADGTMTGFGGGVETKRWLLALERTGEAPAWSPREREAVAAARTQLGLFG